MENNKLIEFKETLHSRRQLIVSPVIKLTLKAYDELTTGECVIRRSTENWMPVSGN